MQNDDMKEVTNIHDFVNCPSLLVSLPKEGCKNVNLRIKV